MEWIIAFAGTGAFSALYGVWRIGNRKTTRQFPAFRRARLQDIAARRGGRFDRHGYLVLDLDRCRTTILLEYTLDDRGNAYSPGTRWRAELQPPGTTPFAVYPEGLASATSKLLGVRELELGVLLAFDRQFMIKARVPASFRRLWTHDLCKLMVDHFPTATLTSTGAQLELVMTPSSDDVLEIGLDLLLAIARADVFGLAVLHGLPDASQELDDLGGVRIKGATNVRLGLHPTGDDYVTRASALAEDHERLAAIEVVDGVVAANDVATLPAHLHYHARELGTARIESIGPELTITWRAIEEDRRRLIAAIELLRKVAGSPAVGVFR